MININLTEKEATDLIAAMLFLAKVSHEKDPGLGESYYNTADKVAAAVNIKDLKQG